MYWSDEKVNGEFVERSMWDFYNRYYCDFGQLLVNMEDRGIHVFFYFIYSVHNLIVIRILHYRGYS